jgi:hypothetical protein
MAVLPDGRTAVFDVQGLAGAFELFGPEGDFERAVRLPDGMLTFMPRLDVDRRGGAVLATRYLVQAFIQFGPFRVDASPAWDAQPIVRMILTGDEVVQDTVAYAGNGGNPEGEANRLVPRLMAGALPEGYLAYTDSSAYAIKVATPTGELERVLTRPFRPEPVTDRVIEEIRERNLRELEESGLLERGAGGNLPAFMTGNIGASTGSVRYYHEIPVVRDLRTTWEGTIWVQRRGDEPESDGPIDILTPDGRYLGPSQPAPPRCPTPSAPTAWPRSSSGTSWTSRR